MENIIQQVGKLLPEGWAIDTYKGGYTVQAPRNAGGWNGLIKIARIFKHKAEYEKILKVFYPNGLDTDLEAVQAPPVKASPLAIIDNMPEVSQEELALALQAIRKAKEGKKVKA